MISIFESRRRPDVETKKINFRDPTLIMLKKRMSLWERRNYMSSIQGRIRLLPLWNEKECVSDEIYKLGLNKNNNCFHYTMYLLRHKDEAFEKFKGSEE